MDENTRLRNEVKQLQARMDSLVEDRKFSGLARIYAAMLPPVVVLPWFPVYAPVKYDDGYGAEFTAKYLPLIAVKGSLGALALIMLTTVLGIILKATFHPRPNTPTAPIVLMVISVVGTVLLLARVGTRHFPDLTDTGIAVTAVLGTLGVLGAVHTALLVKSAPKADRVPPPWDQPTEG